MFQKEGKLFALCLSFSAGPKCHQGKGRSHNRSVGLSCFVLISVLCCFLIKTYIPCPSNSVYDAKGETHKLHQEKVL